jgi:hypothetical protein
VPERARTTSPNGHTEFNEILEQVAQRPLQNFTAKLQEIAGVQNEVLTRLTNAVTEQDGSIKTTGEVLRSKIGTLEGTVARLAASQAQLQQAVVGLTDALTDSTDRGLTAVSASLASTLEDGNNRLSSSLKDYFATETGTIRQEVAELGQRKKPSAATRALVSLCLVILIMQVVVIALVASRH